MKKEQHAQILNIKATSQDQISQKGKVWVNNWQDFVKNFTRNFIIIRKGNRAVGVEFRGLCLLRDMDYGCHFPNRWYGGREVALARTPFRPGALLG